MIAISPDPIDVAALVAAVGDPAHGGICTFVGTTRATSPGDARPVDALDYEAYVDMALAEFHAIAAEARERFGPLAIAIVHRTGRVALGEASVAVAVGAPHRAAAFDACEYAIDTLKLRSPIWKREHYADGETAWIANTPNCHPEPVEGPPPSGAIAALPRQARDDRGQARDDRAPLP